MPLTLERPDRTSLRITRPFAAAPDRLFSAHVDATLVPRWLTGPDGWIMTRCDIDPRPGGTMRLDWSQVDGSAAFHLEARFNELQRPDRIRHVERMFLPDPTPETRVETQFRPEGAGTIMVLTMAVDSPEVMEQMLGTGMADGMEASYARLDILLAGG